MSDIDWKQAVFDLLKKQNLENMTKKKVRGLLAAIHGEETTKKNKEIIKKYTQEFVDSHASKAEEEEEEEEQEDEEEEPKARPTKKRKTPAKSKKKNKDEEEDEDEEKGDGDDGNGDPRLASFSIETAGGQEPPRNLKKMQEGIMSTKYFMKNAPRLELDIWGNKMSGPPRSFSSGNKGWYTGGKALVKVGKKKVWAQIGVNISILGSKEWED